MRGRGKSPSESLTRTLRGMCGPLPGTKAGARGRTGSGSLADVGRREARGAGVLTERSEAERASTRRPEESLSAWSQEPARTRGRPAPQRRSAHHADTAGAKAPRRLRRAGFEPGFKDPSPKGSEADRGLGSGPATGAEPASATEWPRSHIYIYIPITHTSVLPPDSVRGRTRVCVRVRARGIALSERHCKRKPERLFTE